MDIVRSERGLGLARPHALPTRLRGHVQQMELRAAAIGRHVIRAGTQHLILTIVQLAHFRGKDIRKDEVRRLQHLLARAEVARKQQLRALMLSRLRKRRPGVVMLQKDARVGQTEAIDALLDVSDGEQVFSFTGYRVKDAILHLVGILILIHHDLAVARAHSPRKLRRRAVFSDKQADGLVLLIGKVRRVAPALFLVIPAGKLSCQIDEREHRRRHCAQILRRLAGRCVKQLAKALDRRLAAVPQGLHAHFELAAVAVLHRREARERDAHAARGVPALVSLCCERLELVGDIQKRGRVLLVQRVVLRHLLRRRLHQALPMARLAPHLVEQNSAVGRLFDPVRHLAPQRALRIQPFVLIRLGL